jgi:hypothetical protein
MGTYHLRRTGSLCVGSRFLRDVGFVFNCTASDMLLDAVDLRFWWLERVYESQQTNNEGSSAIKDMCTS